MPNQDQVSDELGDIQVIEDTESAVDDNVTEEKENSEQSSQELHLEEDATTDSKLSPAEISAKQQEDSWLAKVIAGKSTVEQAPKWLQSKINSRLEVIGNAPKTEEIVKQALEKERKVQEFKDLQKQIPPLTPTQAKELKQRYSQLKGADNVAALKTVLEAMGLTPKPKEIEAREIAKGKITLPRSGQPAVRKSETKVGNVPLDVIQDEKKWKQFIREGEQGQD